MSMRDRINEGKLYTTDCEGLPEDRLKCSRIISALNRSLPDDSGNKEVLLKDLFGSEVKADISVPFYCTYGKNISIDEGTSIDVNCVFKDDGRIVIGRNVIIGPSVTLITSEHPVHPNLRDYSYAFPIIINDNCMIGANVIIMPGVTIGENSVIAPGSIVTQNIPANVIASGNPCTESRKISENDAKTYHKNMVIDEYDLKEVLLLREGKSAADNTATESADGNKNGSSVAASYLKPGSILGSALGTASFASSSSPYSGRNTLKTSYGSYGRLSDKEKKASQEAAAAALAAAEEEDFEKSSYSRKSDYEEDGFDFDSVKGTGSGYAVGSVPMSGYDDVAFSSSFTSTPNYGEGLDSDAYLNSNLYTDGSASANDDSGLGPTLDFNSGFTNSNKVPLGGSDNLDDGYDSLLPRR